MHLFTLYCIRSKRWPEAEGKSLSWDLGGNSGAVLSDIPIRSPRKLSIFNKRKHFFGENTPYLFYTIWKTKSLVGSYQIPAPNNLCEGTPWLGLCARELILWVLCLGVMFLLHSDLAYSLFKTFLVPLWQVYTCIFQGIKRYATGRIIIISRHWPTHLNWMKSLLREAQLPGTLS